MARVLAHLLGEAQLSDVQEVMDAWPFPEELRRLREAQRATAGR